MKTKNENFVTTLVTYDEAWTDQWGFIGNAYEWAEKNLPAGQRVIGTRILTHTSQSLPSPYVFDFRNYRDSGISLEAEIPARTRTVVRVNRDQMVVVETASNEMVYKFIRFTGPNGPVWRPWNRRTYEHHIERDLPAELFIPFLLQCGRAARDIAMPIRRDLTTDIRQQMALGYHKATPPEIRPLLAYVNERVDALYDTITEENPTNQECTLTYTEILEYCKKFLQEKGVGTIIVP